MSTVLPAGSYAHPERPGETLTLGEWRQCGADGSVRWWGRGCGQAAYWFAEGWHAWPPFAGHLDGRDLPRLARGTGTRDDADRALRQWLQLIDVDGELIHIQPLDPDDDPPFEGSDVVIGPPEPVDPEWAAGEIRRLRALVEQQGAEVVETRGALVAVQREIVALAEELEARPVDVPEAVADEIARRLRALVEGA